MGFIYKNRSNNNELPMHAGADSPAVVYVKMIMYNAIKNSLEEVTVKNNSGIASCSLASDHVPYVNVRNRICIMTNSIKPYNNLSDQFGEMEIYFTEFGRYIINVVDRVSPKEIKLTFSKKLIHEVE